MANPSLEDGKEDGQIQALCSNVERAAAGSLCISSKLEVQASCFVEEKSLQFAHLIRAKSLSFLCQTFLRSFSCF